MKEVIEADDRGKQCLQIRGEAGKERLVSGFKATRLVGLHSLLDTTVMVANS
jgi:hypothetical protein